MQKTSIRLEKTFGTAGHKLVVEIVNDETTYYLNDKAFTPADMELLIAEVHPQFKAQVEKLTLITSAVDKP